MKPYTPTTEGVRDTYVRAHRTDVARAEFDRWLECVKAEAWDEGHNAGYPRVPRPAANPHKVDA